jgi:nucleotide-binding universal stress UspA family protein
MAIVLARHGVTVDVMAVSANGRSTPEALRDTAADIDADLIVMGAYGHSRVRQTILGGTTKDMLSRTRVPLFLAH